jgi:hypothetical protein
MSQLLEKYKAYLPADTGTYSSAEAKRAAMKRDEEHVKLLIDHLRERMTDPFEVEEHPEALINISTRMHASLEIEISLLDAVEDGKQMANSFIKKTLVQNKIVTIQHANQSIIILTECALHQLVHTLTGCNLCTLKSFLNVLF